MEKPEEKKIIVGLDIGTTKIGVVIAEMTDPENVKIVGIGSRPSYGLNKGVVVNIDKTVKSIEQAIEEAELMAGVDVKDVFVGIAGKHIRSHHSRGLYTISRPDKTITVQDVQKVLDMASTIKIPSERKIIHVIPRDFIVDEQTGIKDPVGMSGVRLVGDVHIVTVGGSSEENIQKSVAKAGLNVSAVVLEPLASSYAVLHKDERELGVALIDMGGGTTDISVYWENSILFSKCIEYGGSNITNDLAVGIRTPVDKAEEIKRAHGTCRLQGHEGEFVPVPGVGGRSDQEIRKEFLAQIVHARMKEILDMVNDELHKAKLVNKLGAGIVLTGGGSLLDGAVELADKVFEMPVRLGKPKSLSGITEVVNSPSHATGVGLVLFGAERIYEEQAQKKGTKGEGLSSSLGKFFKVIKNYI